MTPIESALAEVRKKSEQVAAVQNEYRALYRELEKRVATELGIERVALCFFWQCCANPLGFCAYDLDEEPAHDRCLYCGDPEERL